MKETWMCQHCRYEGCIKEKVCRWIYNGIGYKKIKKIVKVNRCFRSRSRDKAGEVASLLERLLRR